MSKYYFFLFISTVLVLSSCKKSADSLFALQDNKQLGIDFINQLKEEQGTNVFTFRNYYNGGGVAIGDVNNDGLEDIYFVSNTSSNKLYLNKGNLKFEDITAKAGLAGTGNWKTGVTIVDINNDGYKDIYLSVVSGYKNLNGKNQLYINNKDLTFTESAAQLLVVCNNAERGFEALFCVLRVSRRRRNLWNASVRVDL